MSVTQTSTIFFWSHGSQHPMYNIINTHTYTHPPKPFYVRPGNCFFYLSTGVFWGWVKHVGLEGVFSLGCTYFFLMKCYTALLRVWEKIAALTLSSSPTLLFTYRLLYFLYGWQSGMMTPFKSHPCCSRHTFSRPWDHSRQAHNLAHTRRQVLPDTHGYACVPDSHRSVAHGAAKFRCWWYLSSKEGPHTTIDSIELDRVLFCKRVDPALVEVTYALARLLFGRDFAPTMMPAGRKLGTCARVTGKDCHPRAYSFLPYFIRRMQVPKLQSRLIFLLYPYVTFLLPSTAREMESFQSSKSPRKAEIHPFVAAYWKLIHWCNTLGARLHKFFYSIHSCFGSP